MNKQQPFASEGIVTKPALAIMSGGHQCDYCVPFKHLPANDRIVDAAVQHSIDEYKLRVALRDFHPDPAPQFVIVEFEPVEMNSEEWRQRFSLWLKQAGQAAYEDGRAAAGFGVLTDDQS